MGVDELARYAGLIILLLLPSLLSAMFVQIAYMQTQGLPYRADFEYDLGGFSIGYSTPNADTVGPVRTNTTAYEGQYSLYFKVSSNDGGTAVASVVSPGFQVSLQDLENYPYLTFYMQFSGSGEVYVAVWVRDSDSITAGIPFHAQPERGAPLCELQEVLRFDSPPSNWKAFTIDLYQLISGWSYKTDTIEFYVEFYVETSSEAILYLDKVSIDTINTIGSNPPDKELRLFVSAGKAFPGAIVRVAAYVNPSDYIGGLRLDGGNIVYVEHKFSSVLKPGVYGKYVAYVRVTENNPVLNLTYIYNEEKYVEHLQLTLTTDYNEPLIVASKTVTLDNGKARVTVQVENVGNTPAYNIKIFDLLPLGTYLVEGSPWAEVPVLKPGSVYVHEYVIAAYADGTYNLPNATITYYDSGGNEFWAWSDDVSVYLNAVYVGSEDIRLLPRLPEPSSHIYVLENQSFVAVSLQGLVNSVKPMIYVVASDLDWFWLRELVAQYKVTWTNLTLERALNMFRDYYTGYVVYDPDFPETIHVAMALSWMNRWLVASPSDESLLERLGIPKKADLRGLFSSREEIYEWLLKNALPYANRRVIVIQSLHDPRGPIAFRLWDYVIATKSISVSLSPSRTSGDALDWVFLEELYDRYRDPGVVLGWWFYDEPANVALASLHGFVIVATDFTPELSLLSAFPLKHPVVQGDESTPDLDPNGVYITIIRSDGDNLCVNYNLMNGEGGSAWIEPNRGAIPLGWTFSPVAAELAPPILQYYFQTITGNDYLVAGPSGYGYYYPSIIRKEYLALKLSFDKHYQGEVLKTPIWNIMLPYVFGDQMYYVLRYYLPYAGVKYLIVGYGRQDFKDIFLMDNVYGAAVMASNSGSGTVDAIVQDVDNVVSSTTDRPLFIVVYTWNWGTSYNETVDIYNVLAGKGYHVVRPDVFFRLAEKACTDLGRCVVIGGQGFQPDYSLEDRAHEVSQQILGMASRLGVDVSNMVRDALSNKEYYMLEKIYRALMIADAIASLGGDPSTVLTLIENGSLDDAISEGEKMLLTVAYRPPLEVTTTVTETVTEVSTTTTTTTETVTSVETETTTVTISTTSTETVTVSKTATVTTTETVKETETLVSTTTVTHVSTTTKQETTTVTETKTTTVLPQVNTTTVMAAVAVIAAIVLLLLFSRRH